MNELLSIIVPMYNVENTISGLLYSLYKQTYSNIEVLLIDDGSTDSTSRICRGWCENDKRFKYFYKENGGVGDARNYGIKRARGDWVAFPDADDEVYPRMYEILISRLKEGVGGVMCNQKGRNSRVSGIYNYKDLNLFDKPSIGFVNSGVFKKGLLFPKLNLFEDNLFVYAFLQNHDILVIPDTLYTYNDTPNSLSKKRYTYNADWWEKYLSVSVEYINNHFVDTNYKNRYNQYFKKKIEKLYKK